MSLKNVVAGMRAARVGKAAPIEVAPRVHLVPTILRGLVLDKTIVITPGMWIGVSALHDLCPRAYTIAFRMGAGLHRRWEAKHRWAADRGTALHLMVQEQWLGSTGKILGTWRCRHCFAPHGDHTVAGAVPRPGVCSGCGAEKFRFEEPLVQDNDLLIRGAVDGILDLENVREVLDIKWTGNLYPVASAPRASDVTQINCYMALAGLDRGRLLYMDSSAKTPEKAMIEHRVTLDHGLVTRVKEKVCALREALKAPETEANLPPCPVGGRGTYGPCACAGLEDAWATHGPRPREQGHRDRCPH